MKLVSREQEGGIRRGKGEGKGCQGWEQEGQQSKWLAETILGSLLATCLCICSLLPFKTRSLPSVQSSSFTQSCPTLCDPSTPGPPVHDQLLESTQTHVHQVGDATQPSYPLPSPSPPALYLSQHQGLFKWVSSSHQMAKVLEFQLQNQSYQWTPRTDLL